MYVPFLSLTHYNQLLAPHHSTCGSPRNKREKEIKAELLYFFIFHSQVDALIQTRIISTSALAYIIFRGVSTLTTPFLIIIDLKQTLTVLRRKMMR